MLSWRSGILVEAINPMHLIRMEQSNSRIKKEIIYVLTQQLFKLFTYWLFQQLFKTILFLLPWTDWKTPNFRWFSILPCQWTQWKQKVITLIDYTYHCTNGNLQTFPESYSFFTWYPYFDYPLIITETRSVCLHCLSSIVAGFSNSNFSP